MSLQSEIDKLKTLQESFNELSSKVLDTQAVLTELNHGKQEMVDALAMKNVQSSADKTLSAIADDVRSIATQTNVIEGGQFYGEQLLGTLDDDIMWNLYKVMESLLSDGRFTIYGGIILAEISKSNNTINLSGAGTGGAYYTSDGVFLEEDRTGVNAYVWQDRLSRKLNRWVAYLLRAEYTNFTMNVYANKVHIGRKVGIITRSSSYGPKEVVCLDGNVYSLAAAQSVGVPKCCILRNILFNNQSSSALYGDSPEKLILSGSFNADSGKYFIRGSVPSEIIFERVDKYNLCHLAYTQSYMPNNIHIVFPYGFVLDGNCSTGSMGSGPAIFRNNDDLRGRVKIDGLTEIKTGTVLFCGYDYAGSVEEIILEDLKTGGTKIITMQYNNGTNFRNLKLLYVPNLTDNLYLPTTNVKSSEAYPSLIDIEVGEIAGNINLTNWGAKNVLADADKTIELANNIHNHIAVKVADKTGGESSTITLYQGVRDILLPETEALFASKNWNIAPAKTVTETTE